MKSDTSPVFVVGHPRSGTSLLRNMLNAHPRIHLTFEACFFLKMVGEPSRGDPRVWALNYLESAAFMVQRLPASELRRTAQSVSSEEELTALFDQVMRRCARRYGKSRFGDKTPHHASVLSRLYRTYPSARVIHIVRDPRAAVASLLRMPWAPSSTVLNAIHYRSQLEAASRFSERMCEIRYEDLISDTRGTMRSVLEFVGEPWSDRVLDHQTHAPTDDVPPAPWFLTATDDRWSAPRRPGLTGAQTRLVERITRVAMRRFGYERAEIDPEPSGAVLARAALLDSREAVWSLARIARIVRGMQREPRLSGRDALLAWMEVNPEAWSHYRDFDVSTVWRWLDEARPSPGGDLERFAHQTVDSEGASE